MVLEYYLHWDYLENCFTCRGQLVGINIPAPWILWDHDPAFPSDASKIQYDPVPWQYLAMA